MAEMPPLSGPSHDPASGKTEQLVILLHGLGADGNDLIGLAPYLAQRLPNAKFIAPNAPYPYDMAPMGYQWFTLQERTPEAMLAGAQSTRPILDAFIDAQLQQHGLTDDRLALVGFSQGTMMSLFTGPRRQRQISGIVGYSGRLIGPQLLAEEVRTHPPVVLVNGDQDELIPVSAQPEAVAGLEAAGLVVEAYIRPGLGHSIDQEGVEIGSAFLAKIFGAADAQS